MPSTETHLLLQPTIAGEVHGCGSHCLMIVLGINIGRALCWRMLGSQNNVSEDPFV